MKPSYRGALFVMLACACARPPPLDPSTPSSSPEPLTTDNPARPRALAKRFDDHVASIIADYFEHDPVSATAAGEHRWDAFWPDLSDTGITADRARIRDALDVMQSFHDESLDTQRQVDRDVLVAELELQAFRHDIEKHARNSPLYYAQLIGNGLDDLVTRDFAPLDQRAADLATRLERLPSLVQQALANLRGAVTLEPHAKVALGQLTGIVELIEREIPQNIAEAAQGVRTRVHDASPNAVEAIRLLEHTIRDELLPRANGHWRLGREAFERKLALTLQTELDAGSVYALAKHEHERIRANMVDLSRDLYASLRSSKALVRHDMSGVHDREMMVRTVLRELSEHRVEAEQLREAAEQTIARLSEFVRTKRLVPIDEREVLEIIWTPPHQRGVAIAGLAAPGPLDDKPGLPSFYLVQPVPLDWSPHRRDSFVREYNRFMLEILSIHEAIPGHFVQLYHAKRHSSLVRKVFANGPFVEGWAVYAEHLMVEADYTGPAAPGKRPRSVSPALWRVLQDPALRAKAIALHAHKFYLRSVTNAILDHAIHVEGMSENDAITLMTFHSYQEEGEARAKWVRAQVSSTQLSTYFVGAQAWFRVRAQAQARAKARGEIFDLEQFHRFALAHGAPPVHRLPELLGWSIP